MSRTALSLTILVALIAVAFALRLDGITTPPFDNAVARQFHAALLARTYYLDESTLSRRDQAIVDGWRQEDQPIEPPAMELLAAAGYHVIGHEALWFPRALSAFFWICGGLLLYALARQLRLGAAAALASCAVYLFLPFGALASRAFQPDPLLVLTLIAAILCVVRYDDAPSRGRLVAAGATLAAAFAVKPGIAAPIVLPLLLFVGFRLWRRNRREARRALAGLALATLPMFAWYAYGTIATSYLRGHFREKVSPSLLVHSSFWHGWWDQIVFALTYPPKSTLLTLVVLAAATAGVLLARTARTKLVLASLWAGYVIYGLIFTIHISTHNYYSLPLVPILALSLGSLVDVALERIPRLEPASMWLVAVGGLVAAGAVSWKLHPAFTDPSFDRTAARYARAGADANHTARALYVDTHYAEPVRYYGWTAGVLLTSGYETNPGPLATRTLATELGKEPPPSCVIFTGRGLRDQLSSFETAVAARYAAVEKSSDLAIYDLTTPANSQPDGC